MGVIYEQKELVLAQSHKPEHFQEKLTPKTATNPTTSRKKERGSYEFSRLQKWIDCGKRLYSLSENDACLNVLLDKALQRRTVHTLVLKNPPASFLPKPVDCCSKYNASHGITTSELPCPTQNPRRIHWIIGNPIAL